MRLVSPYRHATIRRKRQYGRIADAWWHAQPVSALRRRSVEKLVVATRNLGKVQEFERLLMHIPFELISLDEAGVPSDMDVEETGSTFYDNAGIKARAYAEASGLLTLAEDSGLEVDTLGGEPGVRSARYGGPGYDDEGRVRLLLDNMKNIPWEERAGRFRSTIAISTPAGKLTTVEGSVEGMIIFEPRGTGGFGYDPIFYVPSIGKTTSEMSMDEKNVISHRAKAAQKALALLREWPT